MHILLKILQQNTAARVPQDFRLVYFNDSSRACLLMIRTEQIVCRNNSIYICDVSIQNNARVRICFPKFIPYIFIFLHLRLKSEFPYHHLLQMKCITCRQHNQKVWDHSCHSRAEEKAVWSGENKAMGHA